MALDPWIYAVSMGIILSHLLVVYVAYRSDSPSSSTSLNTAREDDLVECTHCGEVNEAVYRFCRECIGELPSRLEPAGSGATPAGRGIL